MNFECHITVDLAHVEQATKAAELLAWKTSEIARDPVLGQASYFYLTKHDVDYIRLFDSMRILSQLLQNYDVPVIRQKIELIMYDTKGKL